LIILSSSNRATLVAAAGCVLASSALAQIAPNALPSGGSVAAGSATISSPAAGTLQIDQASERAILNWQSFSIGSAAWVRFNQPGAGSVALNRVVGADPSQIFGRLTANGQVFLANPNGVLFAPGASVEVGSLFATTLSITNDDFLAGRYRFFREGNVGTVVNEATIVTPNGYAALAGPRVRNDGVIIARLGSVALAAGERVSLDMIGDGLINVSVDQAAMDASVIHTGTIEADGGRVLLTARSANALLDTVINSSGTIRATRLAERNGAIVLDSGTNGIVQVSGVLDAYEVTVNSGVVIPEPRPIQPTGGDMAPVITANITINVEPLVHPATLTLGGTASVSATSAGSVAIGSTIPEVAQATKPMPQAGGAVTLQAANQPGTLAPMLHAIEGAGVASPPGVTLLPGN
jgi:filamentous hemagglutinin family protein